TIIAAGRMREAAPHYGLRALSAAPTGRDLTSAIHRFSRQFLLSSAIRRCSSEALPPERLPESWTSIPLLWATARLPQRSYPPGSLLLSQVFPPRHLIAFLLSAYRDLFRPTRLLHLSLLR